MKYTKTLAALRELKRSDEQHHDKLINSVLRQAARDNRHFLRPLTRIPHLGILGAMETVMICAALIAEQEIL